MTYENNDGPIYSMLSGKVLNTAPCDFGDPCPGGAGYCNVDVINSVSAWESQGYNMNDALVWCQNNSFGSGCLGTWQEDKGYGAGLMIYFAWCE
jgi:hypothetical protein